MEFIAIMIFAIISPWIISSMEELAEDFVGQYTEVSFVNEEVQEIEHFEILKCLNETLLVGSGGGNSEKFAMSVNTENVFVFYTADDEKMIERKEIPFDFKIKEEKRNSAELILYQKYVTENICDSIMLFEEKKCVEETRSEPQYYILYVPLGTFDGSISLN